MELCIYTAVIICLKNVGLETDMHCSCPPSPRNLWKENRLFIQLNWFGSALVLPKTCGRVLPPRYAPRGTAEQGQQFMRWACLYGHFWKCWERSMKRRCFRMGRPTVRVRWLEAIQHTSIVPVPSPLAPWIYLNARSVDMLKARIFGTRTLPNSSRSHCWVSMCHITEKYIDSHAYEYKNCKVLSCHINYLLY